MLTGGIVLGFVLLGVLPGVVVASLGKGKLWVAVRQGEEGLMIRALSLAHRGRAPRAGFRVRIGTKPKTKSS